MNDPAFKDKVEIITGSSSGIGRELAHQLADQGTWLVFAARNVERLEAAKVECQKRGGKAIVIPTDVGIQAQCAHIVQGTMEEFGRIDGLVNNAGITMWGNFDAVNDLGLFEQIMRVNYMGSLYCTHYALPFLKQTKGLIVGMSSLAGKAGIPTRSGYAASKHAMTGFFDSLRIEMEPFRVGVTMVYPGFVASDMCARALGWDGNHW